MALAEFNRKAATAEAIGEYHRTDRNHENEITFFIKGDGDFYNARAKILQAEVRIKLYFSLKEKNRL